MSSQKRIDTPEKNVFIVILSFRNNITMSGIYTLFEQSKSHVENTLLVVKDERRKDNKQENNEVIKKAIES